MSTTTLLVIVLILLVAGGFFPFRGGGYGFGPYGYSVPGALLLLILVLAVLGKI